MTVCRGKPGPRSAQAVLPSERPESEARFGFSVAEHGGDYFQTVHHGRGLAIGDLDNDGRPDLVISHLNEPVTLFRTKPSAGARTARIPGRRSCRRG
jgi:hypothetical protein